MANKSKAVTYGHACKGSLGDTTMFFVSSTLAKRATVYEPSEAGMIGTDRPENTGRQNLKEDVSGNVVIRPSYAHAAHILGAVFDETGGTFTPADAPNALDVDVVLDKSVDTYTYADCFPQILKLSGAENQPVDWLLDLLGQDETDAGSVAALAIPDVMLFSDLALSINSNAYFPKSFEWTWTYAYDERFHNSVTRSSVAARIPRADLVLGFDVNSDTWDDLLDLAGTDTAISDVVLTFADGTSTITITHETMTNENPQKLPDVSGVDALDGTLNLRAWLKNGSTDIVTLTYAAS